MSIIFQVMVAPPLYRNQPFWYQRGLTQIASRFSLTFSEGKPDNLFLLPSFNCQDLLPDGAFLNPVSGLHYVLHLFDSSEAALDIMASSGNVQFGSVKETVRLHDDRMTYIESRHVHLQNRVDHRIAIDAEFNDWVLNRSEEDWLVVQGLPRLSNDLSNHDWQKAAKKQVTELIKFVLNIDRSNLSELLGIFFLIGIVLHSKFTFPENAIDHCNRFLVIISKWVS